jgi:hypothetical protein
MLLPCRVLAAVLEKLKSPGKRTIIEKQEKYLIILKQSEKMPL